MADILIRNCEVGQIDTLTTVQEDILLKGNRIAAIGPHLAGEGCEVLEADHMLALPSFADCHTHMTQTALKGPMDAFPITTWLIKLFEIEAVMTPEENYYSCLLGALSALRCGTTAINDMVLYQHLDSTIAALKDSGIRAVIGVTTTDVAENEKTRLWTVDQAMDVHREVYAKVHGLPRLRPSVAPAGLPACSRELMQACKAFAREKGMIFHTHLAEGKKETEEAAARYGLKGEAEALYRFGLLDDHTLLAHSIWLDDQELDLIRDSGAVPVYCPSTNLKIGDGIPRMAEMEKRGIPLVFGCDGEASSANRDLVREARLGAYLQKGRTCDPQVFAASAVYRMMTKNGFHALGYPDLGELKEGNRADLILVDMDHDLSLLNPAYRMNNFLYAADGKAVDTVFLDGEMVVRHGHLTQMDEEKIRAEAIPVLEGLARKIQNL